MKRSKIPTLLALIILTLGLAAGVFLVQTQKFFQPKADATQAPRDLRITNINDTSFNVSWVTEKELSGFIKWGSSSGNLNKTQNGTEGNTTSFTHSVTVASLTPGTIYYFNVNSGGDVFDNNGNAWQVTTALQPGNKEPVIASGTVVSSSGSPVNGALVYLTVGGGSPLSTVTSENGTWVVPISTVYAPNLSSFLEVSNDTLIDIFVNAGPAGVASAKVLPPVSKKTPPIVLGKTLDFRTLTALDDPNLPNATLDLPESVERASKFNAGALAPNENKVSVDSIVQGEVINTTKPQFFGTAPKNSNLVVTIESEVITTSVQTDADGNWKLDTPGDLSPGTHKITITWTDSRGLLQSLTRSFVVMAAEGPAFSASDSASPTGSPTNTPTITPTPTINPTISPTLTPFPDETFEAIPTQTPQGTALLDTGSLTPTILLFIMGIGTLMLGILVWRRPD